jgi:hypothetical protein
VMKKKIYVSHRLQGSLGHPRRRDLLGSRF